MVHIKMMGVSFLTKKVNWKILDIFLNNPSNKYSFSDLVALSKSGPTNVKKAINDLNNNYFFTIKKEGNRILYQINLDNNSVKHLFQFYAWNKLNKFSENVRNGIKILVQKLIQEEIFSIYLFGSSIYKTNPKDLDLAVIYNKKKEKLNDIWLEIIKDFQENIELHPFQKEEFIKSFIDGDYKITSTLNNCLILYDKDFIFDYLSKIPLPTKKILLREINILEEKLEKCFKLYKTRKEDCEELLENNFTNFLRLFISHKKEIPDSKHSLNLHAKKLGLNTKKRNLWEKLEWMEKTIKKIKTTI